MNTQTAFGVLGPLVIHTADGSANHPTGREARVLAAMLLSVNEAISTQELIDIVWADSPPSSPETALHNVVYRLRRLLVECGTDATIEKAAEGYSLQTDPTAVDAIRFEQMLATAQQASSGDARWMLDAAIEMWRGELFGSLMNGTRLFNAEAERLNALRWIAIEDRIACDLAAGHYRDVIPELVGLTTTAPIRETLWGFLMAALYLSDQRGRALQAYHEATGYLAAELGIGPGRSLQDLEQAIIDQDDDRVETLVMRQRS